MLYCHQCALCENFWSSQASPEVGYRIITRMCPDCIEKRLPPIQNIPVPPPMRHDLTRPWVPRTTNAGAL